MKLLYKTLGHASPIGMQRVFFCASEIDHKHYFDILTKDIWNCQDNVAVYYKRYADIDEDTEERYDYLDQVRGMQLIVVPITSDFLSEDSVARTVEFEYAINNNIPVLLIAVEENISSYPDFNKLIKSRQYLNKYKIDDTAIPYSDKLASHLSRVLVGGEMEKSIRDAFAGYFFLSYRKKDREYANKIMEFIHSIDATRDIAIWYDEFLVPGENFREDINRALNKSCLYILSVTPNLLEKPNFIMDVEYKLARDNSIEVFPIEMVPTDSEELKSNYAGIPDCYKGDEEILAAIKSFLDNHPSLGKKTNDPEHLVNIALAYLNGIDVEVNRTRGIKLLEEAASQNYPLAYKYLSNIYDDGIGVSPDVDKAIVYSEKYVSLIKEETDFDDVNSRQEYLHAVFDFIRILVGTDELDMYKRWCNELIDVSRPDEDAIFLMTAYSLLGKQAMANESISEAREYLVKAYEYGVGDDNQIRQALLLMNLGDLESAESNLEKAYDYYDKALKISSAIMYKDNKVVSKELYATCLHSAASVLENMGRFGEAKTLFFKELGFVEELIDINSSYSNYESAIKCHNCLSRILMGEGNYETAKYYNDKALNYAKLLLKNRNDIKSKYLLAQCYDQCANIFMDIGAANDAQEMIEAALGVFDEEGEVVVSAEIVKDIARMSFKLGSLYLATNNVDKAMEYTQRAIQIYESFVSGDSSLDLMRQLAICYIQNARILNMQREYASAVEVANEACSILEGLVEFSATYEFEFSLINGYFNLIQAYMRIGDIENFILYCEKAINECDKCLKISPQDTIYMLAANICECRAVYHMRNDREEAIYHLNKALEYLNFVKNTKMMEYKALYQLIGFQLQALE
ncbi:MAG: TIR domain-containing protein [Clostridia bacterium]|nr:TIR domain-containing protein [Clostridia bacterium]